MTGGDGERYNTYLHGDLASIATILDNGTRLDADDLSAVLVNMIDKMDRLHGRIVQLELKHSKTIDSVNHMIKRVRDVEAIMAGAKLDDLHERIVTLESRFHMEQSGRRRT